VLDQEMLIVKEDEGGGLYVQPIEEEKGQIG